MECKDRMVAGMFSSSATFRKDVNVLPSAQMFSWYTSSAMIGTPAEAQTRRSSTCMCNYEC